LIVQLIIVQIITFAGLVLVLRKILLSSSVNETRRLQDINASNALKAQELARQMEDAEKEYKEKMAMAEKEARSMREKAKKEGDALKEERIAEGKQEAERIIQQALNAKGEMRIEIEEQMQEKSADFSYKIIRKILSGEGQKMVHDGLVAEGLKELDKIDAAALKEIGDKLASASGLAVEIRTPHAMSSPQKEKLIKILSSKTAKDVNLQEVVDQDIVAGFIVKLDSFVIDGSLLEKFKKAAETLK